MAVQAIEILEPHVPWKLPFLAVRAKVYQETDHHLAPLAARQLAEFKRNTSDDAIIPLADRDSR